MDKVSEILATGVLPSYLQIGDYCDVVISNHLSGFGINKLTDGRVIKVHFSIGKVTYDLEFTFSIDPDTNKRYTTRIHNVDSAFCDKK